MSETITRRDPVTGAVSETTTQGDASSEHKATMFSGMVLPLAGILATVVLAVFASKMISTCMPYILGFCVSATVTVGTYNLSRGQAKRAVLVLPLLALLSLGGLSGCTAAQQAAYMNMGVTMAGKLGKLTGALMCKKGIKDPEYRKYCMNGVSLVETGLSDAAVAIAAAEAKIARAKAANAAGTCAAPADPTVFPMTAAPTE